jgi:hypothetical protein
MADIYGEKNQHGGTSKAIFGGLLHRIDLDHNRKRLPTRGARNATCTYSYNTKKYYIHSK